MTQVAPLSWKKSGMCSRINGSYYSIMVEHLAEMPSATYQLFGIEKIGKRLEVQKSARALLSVQQPKAALSSEKLITVTLKMEWMVLT
jgi:hypothetical protein